MNFPRGGGSGGGVVRFRCWVSGVGQDSGLITRLHSLISPIVGCWVQKYLIAQFDLPSGFVSWGVEKYLTARFDLFCGGGVWVEIGIPDCTV
jgi:hypothetical protein